MTGVSTISNALEPLKPEQFEGAGGMATRHDAMLAAEGDADYVMFGEPDATGTRPGFAAIEERVAWWAELFEILCVGCGASIDDIAPLIAAGADFIARGDFIGRDPIGTAATISEAARLLPAREPAE